MKRFGKLTVQVVSGVNLRVPSMVGQADIYVKVRAFDLINLVPLLYSFSPPCFSCSCALGIKSSGRRWRKEEERTRDMVTRFCSTSLTRRR